MLTRQVTVAFPNIIKRNYGITAPLLQKATDPIQQLFVDKIREYKSKSSGGKFVDASPEIQAVLKQEKDKIAKQYGADGQDMTAFPKFTFTDPDINVDKKQE